jgi:hypothetical protein
LLEGFKLGLTISELKFFVFFIIFCIIKIIIDLVSNLFEYLR